MSHNSSKIVIYTKIRITWLLFIMLKEGITYPRVGNNTNPQIQLLPSYFLSKKYIPYKFKFLVQKKKLAQFLILNCNLKKMYEIWIWVRVLSSWCFILLGIEYIACMPIPNCSEKDIAWYVVSLARDLKFFHGKIIIQSYKNYFKTILYII